MKSCRNCYWFEPVERTEANADDSQPTVSHGICYGHGPSVHAVLVGGEGENPLPPRFEFVTVWPEVEADGRCPRWATRATPDLQDSPASE